MNKRIEIVVDPKGNSTVETKGFAGSECLAASKFLEQALGQQTSQRKTVEFYNLKTQNSVETKDEGGI